MPLRTSFDWQGDFRGFFDDKNGLGALAALGILVGGAVRAELETRGARLINLLYLGGWLAIIALAHSKTSLGLILIVPALYIGLLTTAGVTRLGIGVYLILLPVVLAAALTFIIQGMGITPLKLLALISPDATFTGRTSIWSFAFASMRGHWLLGYGYQSFWNVGAESPNLKAPEEFVHLLNQAHNGYLDVLLTIGAIGLALLLGTLAQGFAAASRARRSSLMAHRLCWLLLIFALLHNGTESSFVRGFTPTWLFTLFALMIAARAAAEGRVERVENLADRSVANAALRESL